MIVLLILVPVLEIIVPILPSLAIPLLIVFDEARVIFEIVPPEAFVIPFVMVLLPFRAIFEIVPLLLTMLPIEEVPPRVRLSILP